MLIGTRRGFFQITERGKQVLSKNPVKIDDNYLKQFPEFIEFQKAKRKESKQESKENEIITQQNERVVNIFSLLGSQRITLTV